MTGIADDGFYINLGNMLAKFVPFKDVKGIKIDKSKDMVIKINVFGTLFRQVYDGVYSDKIEDILHPHFNDFIMA